MANEQHDAGERRRAFLRSSVRAIAVGATMGTAGMMLANSWRLGLCFAPAHACPDCKALDAGCGLPDAIAERRRQHDDTQDQRRL